MKTYINIRRLLYLFVSFLLWETSYASSELGLSLSYKRMTDSTTQSMTSSLGYDIGLFQIGASYQISKSDASYEIQQEANAQPITLKANELVTYIQLGLKLYIPVHKSVFPYISLGFGVKNNDKTLKWDTNSYTDKTQEPVLSPGLGVKIPVSMGFSLELTYQAIFAMNEKATFEKDEKGKFIYDDFFSAGISIKM